MEKQKLDTKIFYKREISEEEQALIDKRIAYCNKFVPKGYKILNIIKKDNEDLPSAFTVVKEDDEDRYTDGILVYTEYGIKKNIHRDMINSGLGDIQAKFKYSFDTYETKERYQKEAKAIAMAYVNDYNNENWFIVHGVSGSGKSHLSTSIVYGLASKGINTKYISWVKFKNTLLDEMNYGTANDRILDIINVPVLYIDDFLKTGGDEPTRYEKDTAHRIIEHRNLKNLVTIISTEWSMNELLGFNDAMAGRIASNVNGYYYDFGKDKTRNYRISNRKSNEDIIRKMMNG